MILKKNILQSSVASFDRKRMFLGQITVWMDDSCDDQRFNVTMPTVLGQGPPRTTQWPDNGDIITETDVVVVPIPPQSGAIAAVIVLAAAAAHATLNRVLLDWGLHLARHSDRLEVNGHVYWLSAVPTAQQTSYDAAMHGDDVHCYLSQARLRPGQRIAICPGMPGQACGAIYKAEAWELALSAEPPMPCANCGYHPSKVNWTPPTPRKETPFAERFQFLQRAKA